MPSTGTSRAASSLTWEQAIAWRVRRHGLEERIPRKDVLDVVSALCGVHAQVMSSAELTLWARVDGLRRDDVNRALWQDRSLVKIWAMRGTLHLVPTTEYPMWQAALGTYDHYLRPSWSKYFGVEQGKVESMIDAVGRALDGRLLTREELAGEVARLMRDPALGDALLESWGALLKPASFRGALCFAPNDGQKVRFTNPVSWLGVTKRLDNRPQALLETVRRFLSTYGPTSRDELARWWGGISPAGAERLIRTLGDEAVPVDIEGTDGWALADQIGAITETTRTRSVRLLPAFDQYVIGSTKHADRLLHEDLRDRVHRKAGWVSPVLLVDGHIEGVWNHERAGKGLSVTVEAFGRVPSRVRRGVEHEADLLASFFGGALELTWTT
jgi:winged helix DNA-binding protein